MTNSALYPTVIIPTHTPPVQISLAGTMVYTVDCIITAGTDMSSVIDMTQPNLQGFLPLAIALPAVFTTAHLSFQASYDTVTWGELHTLTSGAVQSSATYSSGDVITLDGYPFRGLPYFRIRSGHANNPTTQVATCTLKVICGTY